MSKSMFVFVNTLIYFAIVASLSTLEPGSFGNFIALLVGGLIFAALGVAVEPVLSFFKFPVNFWGLLLVGFLLNLVFFGILSFGVLPAILQINAGDFGGELSPLPFPRVNLSTSFVVALLASLLATLTQISVRRLSS